MPFLGQKSYRKSPGLSSLAPCGWRWGSGSSRSSGSHQSAGDMLWWQSHRFSDFENKWSSIVCIYIYIVLYIILYKIFYIILYIYIYMYAPKSLLFHLVSMSLSHGFDDFFTVDYARRQPKRPNNWTTLMQVGVCVWKFAGSYWKSEKMWFH